MKTLKPRNQYGLKTARKQNAFRGDRLRALRTAHNMTQQELADYLEVTRVTVTNLENAVSECSFRVLILIAYRFDVTTDYLLDVSSAMLPEVPTQSLPFDD